MKFLISSDDDLEKIKRVIPYCNRSLSRLKKSIKNKKIPELRIAIAQLETIPIELNINTRLEKTWGLTTIYQRVYIIDRFYLTLSSEIFDFGRKMTYEIISHEMSHLLEFSLRRKSDHGKIWKQLHLWMGGSGTSTIDEDKFE